jgi:putative selenate reductase
MPDVAPLTPYPFGMLLGRIAHEWETRGRILDLPKARIWSPDPDVDLSFSFVGRTAATPVGPAAGPHSQLTQNIILGWLAGARLFELKTVQVMDDLEIGRPCIDMETIGYNIEWSQELKVTESLHEYVKAWIAIELLKHWEPIRELVGDDPGAHVFDMSVGYDLAGIKTDKVAGFIRAMRDATAVIDRFRAEIPAPFDAWADIDIPSRLSDTVTLSTFHGCPPDEIEAITKHLVTEHDTDVIVKLNPTLLGYETVDEIIHGVLGYDYIQLDRDAFDNDLQFDRGVELIGELRDFAAARGRQFGIKLTNTLVVRNHKGWMPDDPMYLSGPPLHVLASALLDKLATAMPDTLQIAGQEGDVMVSFSAGIDKENVATAIGTGVNPATICSDLLKPGGYGRLAPLLKALTNDMKAAGCTDLASWRTHRQQLAAAAGHPTAVAHHVAEMLDGTDTEKYALTGNSKLPRQVDHVLEMWGCVACNFCVTVCPNDAFFRLPTPEGSGIDGRQQYFVLVEQCNECGNCLTFCPEEGDPAQIKPKLFTDEGRFAAAEGQAFLVRSGGNGANGGGVTVEAKPGWESEVPRLVQMLNAEEGIPIRVGDL